jgi:hypothetical protein
MCRSSASVNSTFHEHTTSIIELRPRRLASCLRRMTVMPARRECVSAASPRRSDQPAHPLRGVMAVTHADVRHFGPHPHLDDRSSWWIYPRWRWSVHLMSPNDTRAHLEGWFERRCGCPSPRNRLAKHARLKSSTPEGCPPRPIAKREPGSMTRDVFHRRGPISEHWHLCYRSLPSSVDPDGGRDRLDPAYLAPPSFYLKTGR